MTIIDARLERTIKARGDRQYGEALSLLQEVVAEGELTDEPTRSHYFLPMLEWEFLLPLHAPARAAMMQARDEQSRRLLDGDLTCGRKTSQESDAKSYQRVSRFSLIVGMNEKLADARATHALFVELEARQPELAQRYAWQALPAIVESGDFALADRYRGDPLALLDQVNEHALTMPLIPPPGTAPRLSADLSNLVKDARLGAAVLHGLGREAEAIALRKTLLAGLTSDALRVMAQRELDDPGTIIRELVACQMAQEDAAAGQPAIAPQAE